MISISNEKHMGIFIKVVAIIAVVVTLIISVIFAYNQISELPWMRQKKCNKAVEYVNGFFESLEKDNVKGIDKYFDSSTIMTPSIKQYSIEQKPIFDVTLKGMDVTIHSAEFVDKDIISVNVSASTYNMGKVFGKALISVISNNVVEYSHDSDIDFDGKVKKEISGEFENELSKGSFDRVEKNFQMLIRTSGGRYKIENVSDDLLDILTGGINNAIDAVERNGESD